MKISVELLAPEHRRSSTLSRFYSSDARQAISSCDSWITMASRYCFDWLNFRDLFIPPVNTMLARRRHPSGCRRSSLQLGLRCSRWRSQAASNRIGNESVPKQLAQCWFPGLAISIAKIQICFCSKIYGNNFYRTALGN